MKQLLFFLITLQFISTTKSQDLSKIYYPDRFENPKAIVSINKIKSETIYELTSSKKNADSTKTDEITYDTDGNIIVKQSFSKNIMTIKESYLYTADKKLHQIIKDFYSPKDYRIFEYEYDNLGNEIREYNYNKDTTNLIIDAKVYNNKDQLIEYYRKNNNDSFKLVKKYSYNENGILTKIELYNFKGLLSGTYSYIIDTNNNYKTAYYQSIDEAKKKEEFIYNSLNQCIKVDGYAIQPIVYINDDDNSRRKNDIKIIPKVEDYEYNNDGTLFQVIEKVDKKLSKIRRHYYSKY